jgi:hypothetical protein
MALNQNAQAALSLNGNASIIVTAPKCVVQVNSSNPDAVDMTGNASISSTENCFVGGLRSVGNASITPQPDASCKGIPDPFKSYPRPTVGPCTYNNYSLSGNKTVTLQPGVYCGGMSFSGPVNVTFAPGLYVIQDGTISETGGSFTGNGVAIFLTGQGAGIQLSGQADWHIVAPTSGPLAGFAIFLDPSGPTGLAADSSMLSGQSQLYFRGHRVLSPAAGHGDRHGVGALAVTLYVVHRRHAALRRQRRAGDQQQHQPDGGADPDRADGSDRRQARSDAIARGWISAVSAPIPPSPELGSTQDRAAAGCFTPRRPERQIGSR